MRLSVRIRRDGSTFARHTVEGDADEAQAAMGEFMENVPREDLVGHAVIVDLTLEVDRHESLPPQL